MTVLYVTEPGAVVRYEAGSLTVWREEEPDQDDAPRRRRKLAALEPHRLEALVLLGNTHITANAMKLCAANRVAVALLDAGGNLAARVLPPQDRTADLRLQQYALHHDQAERLIRARAIVFAKIANARAVLESIRANHASDTLAKAIAGLKEAEQQVGTRDAVADLLGAEGHAARQYFAGLTEAFRGDIAFTGRARRPPPDPANAMLSFAYVLLSNRITGLLEARGLDPCLGFFHELRPGRPSLALDLLEELRQPVVDRLVLRLCNLKRIRPAHFEPDLERPGGVRLTVEGRRTFLEEWEAHLAKPLREEAVDIDDRLDVHRLLRRQVDRFVADLRGGEPYRPFRFRR